MKIKTCSICKVEKETSEFHKNPTKPDGLSYSCKECRKIYHREHYLKNKSYYIDKSRNRIRFNRENIRNYKRTLCCEKCGENRWFLLDFHHLIEKKKDMEICKLIGRGISLKRIQEEIEKCSVLCSNCHREFHYLENHTV